MSKKKLTVKDSSYERWFRAGYDSGMHDALIVIAKLLEDNNINMEKKEFWKEYKLLKKEGKI